MCIYVEVKKTRPLATTVFPLLIKYTVVTRGRYPVDTVIYRPGWVDCTNIRLREYTYFPPPGSII